MTEDRRRPAQTRILIIDDDPLVRLLATQAAEALGFETEEAVDGEQGLAALEARPPDLVFLDVDMPVLNGFETCAAIRARGHELPVLIATGLTDTETIDRAFEVGATDFINKPLDWHVLRHRIRFLLRASRAFADLRKTLSDLQSSRTSLATARRLGSIGNWEWSPSEEGMIWSEELYRMLGLRPSPSAATIDALLGAVHPEDRDQLEKTLRSAVEAGEGWSLDHRIVTSGGATRIVHHQAERRDALPGADATFAGTIQDITDRRRAEERIHQLANFDGLTSLPNRQSLRRHLEKQLEHARTQSTTMALLSLDLDRFKRINETMGHALGDDLLRAVADRLVETVQSAETSRHRSEMVAPVSRLGADEFAVVLTDIGALSEAAQMACRMLDAFRRPFQLDAHEVVMGACIGIALAPNDAEDADTLLRNADSAMHQAKVMGGHTYSFFNESMNQRAIRALQLESGLRRAIDDGELLLHYQPLKNARTGRITGVEALVRWQSPDFGFLPPGEFIPLAEETGLIEPLGQWVLMRACTELQTFDRPGHPPLTLSVNVSSQQVKGPGIVQVVEDALTTSGLDPRRLELEITESAILGQEADVIEALQTLKDKGVGLALDDFGTGYSSLTHLIRFPIDRLKIDRSFVSRIGHDPQSDAIVSALVGMAHRLGLSVTAEGIETESQERFLVDEGCDVLQGYRIGRPAEASTVSGLLLPSTEDES